MRTPDRETGQLEHPNVSALRTFYNMFSPRMVPFVDRTLNRWKGRETKLAERIAVKYKTDPPKLVVTSFEYEYVSPRRTLTFDETPSKNKPSSPVFRKRLIDIVSPDRVTKEEEEEEEEELSSISSKHASYADDLLRSARKTLEDVSKRRDENEKDKKDEDSKLESENLTDWQRDRQRILSRLQSLTGVRSPSPILSLKKNESEELEEALEKCEELERRCAMLENDQVQSKKKKKKKKEEEEEEEEEISFTDTKSTTELQIVESPESRRIKFRAESLIARAKMSPKHSGFHLLSPSRRRRKNAISPRIDQKKEEEEEEEEEESSNDNSKRMHAIQYLCQSQERTIRETTLRCRFSLASEKLALAQLRALKLSNAMLKWKLHRKQQQHTERKEEEQDEEEQPRGYFWGRYKYKY